MESNFLDAYGPNDNDEKELKKLIADYRQGDQGAYARIVEKYHSSVESLAYRMVHDHDEAADIAQDVFVKMARNIDQYDEKRRFYTWLYRITVNASIDHIRRNRRHQHESLDGLTDVESAPSSDPEVLYLRERLRSEIRESAGKLNPRQRSAFLLRDLGERKVDDVAGIMNMPEATVRWYLHRARSLIRKDLLRRCPHLLILLGIR
jgi:RNA polymerase sigma-70 factor (ECF subfamily)